MSHPMFDFLEANNIKEYPTLGIFENLSFKPIGYFVTREDGKAPFLYHYDGTTVRMVRAEGEVQEQKVLFFESREQLILENPALEDCIYLVDGGLVFSYNGIEYIQMAVESLQSKKERFSCDAEGNIIEIEISMDGFLSISEKRTYEYLGEEITKEVVFYYSKGKKQESIFSYDSDGNISAIDTVVSEI